MLSRRAVEAERSGEPEDSPIRYVSEADYRKKSGEQDSFEGLAKSIGMDFNDVCSFYRFVSFY